MYRSQNSSAGALFNDTDGTHRSSPVYLYMQRGNRDTKGMMVEALVGGAEQGARATSGRIRSTDATTLYNSHVLREPVTTSPGRSLNDREKHAQSTSR